MNAKTDNLGRLLVALALLTLGVGLSASAIDAQAMQCQFRGAADALEERPSPLDSVDIPLGEGSAKLCYGRPSARGRTIVGETDPYGQPWRMGANEPTTLHLPFTARLGTVDLDPGVYSLYAIPDADRWTIVVNANTNRWGIPINPQVRSADLGSFVVQTSETSGPVETLTFSFEGGGSSGALIYAWERTTFRIPIARR